MKLRLKYIVEDVDRHGNVRVYVRRNGQKTRLRAEIGSPEFVVEYRAALAELEGKREGERERVMAVASQGSLRWLVEKYYGCAEFKQLEERTRRVRRGILDRLCEAASKPGGTPHGQKPFARMESRHVRAMRDDRVETPEAANNLVKALRQVFGWAVAVGLARGNPTLGVPRLQSGSEGFHTWSVKEVEQFRAHHPIGSKARLALELLLFTGVRRSDAVGLGPQMERDGRIVWTEVKGRKRVVKERELPVLPELRVVLDASQSGHLAYLVTEFGKPFTANGFGNWFRKRCNEADLPHCSAHGLRKAGATIAAENGATEHQLMAIYGWESPKQAALYTKKANRKRMAASAMHLLVPAERNEDQSVPPTARKKAGGTNPSKKPL